MTLKCDYARKLIAQFYATFHYGEGDDRTSQMDDHGQAVVVHLGASLLNFWVTSITLIPIGPTLMGGRFIPPRSRL